MDARKIDSRVIPLDVTQLKERKMKKILTEVVPVNARSVVPDTHEGSAGPFMPLDRLPKTARPRHLAGSLERPAYHPLPKRQRSSPI
jgi:hypothetical protein